MYYISYSAVIPFIILARYAIYYVMPYLSLAGLHIIPAVMGGFCVHLFAISALTALDGNIAEDFPRRLHHFLGTNDEHFTTLVLVPMVLFTSFFAYLSTDHVIVANNGWTIVQAGTLGVIADVLGHMFLPGREQSVR